MAKMKRSPSALTTEYLERYGYKVTSVERTCGPVKKDAFGWGDLLCCDRSNILLVQTTSRKNLRARVKKCLGPASDAVRWWILSGGRAEVHGWNHDGTTITMVALCLGDDGVVKAGADVQVPVAR